MKIRIRRQTVLIAIVLVVGSVLAHLYVEAQTYHPVLKVATPEGFVYTVVQTATADRNACGKANDRFLEPLKAGCKECKVEFARCERTLSGRELAISMGESGDNHMIVAFGLHMAMRGPAEKIKSVCDKFALDMVRSGLPTAACVYPRHKPAG